jgi:uncharacterized membrane protein
MDPVLGAVLSVLMRWIHIFSAITLLGGVLHARYVIAPAANSAGTAALERAGLYFRPFVLWSITGLIVSGIYNLVTKSNIPQGYHMWFGIKMLFALHVLTVSFLMSRSSISQERRMRLMTGIVYSGIVVTLISSYLRFISNWMHP